MKALSFLLPVLWALCSLSQPASAQSNSTPTTGILTEDEYKQLCPIPFSCPNPEHTNACCNCIVDAWKAIIGKITDNSITTITPTAANKYLKDELFNNGLLDDVKKLTHWPKDSWDAILSNRAIVLRTTVSDPKNPDFVASSKCDHIASPKKTILDFLLHPISSKKEDRVFNQILNINITKMAQKKRGCFNDANTNNTDGGLKSSDASLRTTLVHEMGHQYVFANYPDLHLHPKLSDPALVEKLVTMCQEAFAVYTEYSYLQNLAKKGTIKNFNFKDFLDDACNTAQADQAGDKNYQSLYNVGLDYMYYFLCGLDWDGEPDESGCPPFNYLQLEKIANLCSLMRENKLDTSNIPHLKIDENPFLIELNMCYASSETQALATYAELEKRIAHIYSSKKEILTRFLPKNAAAIRQQLASDTKIKSPTDLQTIVILTSQIPNNKPAHMTDEEYAIYLQEEYKKVSPDIRKQTFQVMLEYLSANQYMK